MSNVVSRLRSRRLGSFKGFSPEPPIRTAAEKTCPFTTTRTGLSRSRIRSDRKRPAARTPWLRTRTVFGSSLVSTASTPIVGTMFSSAWLMFTQLASDISLVFIIQWNAFGVAR